MITPRAMTERDVKLAHAIETAANRFPWSEKNFRDSLNSGHYAWVYCDNYGVILGYAIVQLVMDEAHLLNICVEPNMQGQGLGRRIMEHIIDFANTREIALMVLEVRRSNKRAQGLYAQLGFNEMSVRAGYYPAEQGREDAILMGLDLAMMTIFKDVE
jgi:ribosomal-protein-alanine N-acetyltransferase